MKPVAFDYAVPSDVAEAVSLLASDPVGAKIVAGGQSLGPMLNLRLAQPSLLVDVRRIDGMTCIRETADFVEIGACVTHAAIEDGAIPGPVGNLMAQVARDIAYRAIRNRGTIGGSLCHADPAADWVSVMQLLSATVAIQGSAGVREVPVSAFMLSAFCTVLEASELVVAVRVPVLSASARWSYRKFCRKPGEFGEALACVLVDPARSVCRAVIGATDGCPHRIDDARSLLTLRDEGGLREMLAQAALDEDPYAAQLRYAMTSRALAAVECA
jgi:carbon-monoxide dehydrogenase medium subunit